MDCVIDVGIEGCVQASVNMAPLTLQPLKVVMIIIPATHGRGNYDTSTQGLITMILIFRLFTFNKPTYSCYDKRT